MQRGVLVILLTIGVAVATLVGLATENLVYVMAFAVAPLVPWLALTRPRVFVGLAIVGHGFAIVLPGPGNMTAFKVMFVLLTAGVLLRAWRHGRVERVQTVLLSTMATLLVWRLLRNIASDDAGVTIKLLGMVLAGSMVFYSSQLLRRMEDVRVLAHTIAFCGVIVGLAYVREASVGAFLQGGLERVQGPSGNANSSAIAAVRVLLLTLPVVVAARRFRWRVVALLGAGGCLYGVLVCASRGATVSGVIGMMTFAALVARSIRMRLVAVSAVILVIFGAYTVAPESTLERFEKTVSVSQTGEITEVHDSMRSVLAGIALEMIQQRPLLGHGDGSFGRESARVLSLRALNAHNVYLSLAVAYGLPAALLYVMIILSSLVYGLRLTRMASGTDRVYWAAFTAMILADAVGLSVSAQRFNPLSWTVMGIVHIHWMQRPRREVTHHTAKPRPLPGGSAPMHGPLPQPGRRRLPALRP